MLIGFDLFCFLGIAAVSYAFYLTKLYQPLASYKPFIMHMVVAVACLFSVRFLFRIYNNVWRYTSTGAYLKLILADFTAFVFASGFSHLLCHYSFSNYCIEIWYLVMIISTNLILDIAARLTYRILYKRYRYKRDTAIVEDSKVRIAIVGAGQLGAYLANELRGTPGSRYVPICFVDVDRTKVGCSVAGIPVYGNSDIKSIIEKFKISEFVIAISNVDAHKNERLWKEYTSYGCKVKIYDSPFQEDSGGDNKKKRIIRDFSIEDLLFRQPISVSQKENFEKYQDKTILVTGGGGSIGSELCRQLAKCQPKQLVIFDVYENNAYDIQQELKYKYGADLNFAVEIGSIRERERLEAVFKKYNPNIVFHAAAHKHVPLMEHNPSEAVKNNVIGTYNAADLAEKYNVEKFILISTDKAVNPTNVMGATKRICEMIIQSRGDSKTSFAAVRFGNVLGSNGSVIPLFKKQIAAGGPVTITDKRIIRYFMTIPEASQLVMLAGTKAKAGELFILDMGQPVRIYDLAVNMIKLMGYSLGDIEIQEIGLRPGEKLFEELLIKGESVTKTDNDMIFIEKDSAYSRDEIDAKLEEIYAALAKGGEDENAEAVKAAIKKVVPTYFEPEKINNEVCEV